MRKDRITQSTGKTKTRVKSRVKSSRRRGSGHKKEKARNRAITKEQALAERIVREAMEKA